MKSIISYNVNGIRAAAKKDFFGWLQAESPDVLCLQETKAQPEQLDESFLKPPGYHTFWYSAEKKGYSSVAIFSKEKPLHVEYGCGIEKYDREGRILRADFNNFSVISAYFPSGTQGEIRQAFKEEFLEDIQQYLEELRKEVPNLIVSGDYNIAHTEIDIHDPVRNKKNSGFLPHEREWLTGFLANGFVDSFRLIHPDLTDKYSWWTYRAGARKKNKGWRIDYHMITESLTDKCVGANILDQIVHSDHCPIKVEIDV
ncbi:MAG: exodeoxyribonuclease III [Bacteroidota bacterium]